MIVRHLVLASLVLLAACSTTPPTTTTAADTTPTTTTAAPNAYTPPSNPGQYVDPPTTTSTSATTTTVATMPAACQRTVGNGVAVIIATTAKIHADPHIINDPRFDTGEGMEDLGGDLGRNCGVEWIGDAISTMSIELVERSRELSVLARIFVGGMVRTFCDDAEDLGFGLSSDAQFACGEAEAWHDERP